MTTQEVTRMTGVSESVIRRTWGRSRPTGHEPTPVRLSGNPNGRFYWRRSEIEEWLEYLSRIGRGEGLA